VLTPDSLTLRRIGLVVHPHRKLDRAIENAEGWAAANGADIVQIPMDGQDRRVAEVAAADSCDVVLALGGDGTTLAALRAATAAGKPVLGVACGSLGALTAVAAPDIATALERVAAGDWVPRRLPGIAITADGEEPLVALNDLVVVRAGASQVAVDVHLDDELYIRFAGDGLIVATPLGSSAYNLASGGPILAPSANSMVLTPLAPHGGCCPPLVAGSEARVSIDLEPGHGGARIELDGQISPLEPRHLVAEWRPEHATLIEFGGGEPFITGLRRRRILMDSPRVLARDERDPGGPVTKR
jgi:NAD+ kinase